MLNVKADGTVVWNRKTMTLPDLVVKLKELPPVSRLRDHRARGMSVCPSATSPRSSTPASEANIWNVAFATSKAE
ncbi:MAG: hypothetical protein WDN28_31535 [Chthoniobacter sp.]